MKATGKGGDRGPTTPFTSDQLRQELERLHADTYAWALSLCERNQQDAQDVVQTAYLKVLDGRAQFRGRSSFRTFLFGVVRITILEQRRSYGRRFRWLLRVRSDKSPPKTPLAQTVESRRQHALHEALGQLTERQRQAVVLVFYHGLTVVEVADVMGVSVGSARTHYHRAKDALRTKLSAWRRDS